MTQTPTGSTGRRRTRGSAGAWLVVLAFAGLTALLLADPWPYQKPYPPAEAVPAWVVDTATVLSPTLKPETVVAAYKYRCVECHRLFPSPPETERPLTQHRDVILAHGINDRCLNCHHRTNRDSFVAYDGSQIPYDQPQLLCAKCHGPVYRDWTHGVHGRTNGYWSTSFGPLDRKKCIQCHDPHTPAFGSMRPAPGPNTLRMGDQSPKAHDFEETKNPLLIYKQRLQNPGVDLGEGH